MPRVVVDGLEDARLADYRHVRDGELLRQRGLFVAEGRLVVERLLRDGGFTVRSLLLNEAASRALEPHLHDVDPDLPIFLLRGRDTSTLTGFDMHRGCLALVERPGARAVAALLTSARRLVVLEGVTNADNVGGVFRNAAAFAVDAVLLSPTTCDPLYRKAVRTSMGATLQVPFARAVPWPDVLADIRARFVLAALTPQEPAMSIDEFVAAGVPPRLALMIGAEGGGLSPSAQSQAGCRLRIPISSRVDSLNVAVAAGIALSRLGHRPGFDDTQLV